MKKITKYILENSSKVFHYYFSRDIDNFINLVDENFVWIGSYDFQYTLNLKQFLKITAKERTETIAIVHNEEYHPIYEDDNIFVVYGSFNASAWKDKDTFLYTKQRTTLVWKRINDDYKLIHLHCTMARNVALNGAEYESNTTGSWYDYMLSIDKRQLSNKIDFKDIEGNVHFIYPSEIIYITVNYHILTIKTIDDSFDIRKTLSQLIEIFPNFTQTHKSYIVNPLYIKKINRYSATLINDETIPISKNRYEDIKKEYTKNN